MIPLIMSGEKDMIEYIKTKKWKFYLLLFVVTIAITIPLFHPKFDIKQGDGILHISRLMGTFQAITDSQTFSNIMYNFCNGYGYNWNTFYSPLTAYLPLVFKIFTSSFVICLKIFMALTVFVSGVFMYKFVKEVTNSDKIGILAGILYMTLPYRLTDMYIRMAISELTSFVFFPLIFLGLNNIINRNIKQDYYLIIGATGLLLTHNISTLIAAIFCFAFLLCNFKKINKETIKRLVINGIFILTITSFFWAPMLETKFSSQYEVFISDRMGSVDSVARNGISILQLCYTNFQSEFIFEIGLPILILLLSTFFCYKKVPIEYRNIYFCFMFFGLLSMFMATKYFPWHIMPSVFGMIQFPWRMMAFAGFFLSLISAINLYLLLKGGKDWHIYLVLIACIAYTAILIPHLKYDENFNEFDYWYGEYITGYEQTLNSGCASFEYLPEKAQNNKDYIAIRERGAIVLKGNANIQNEIKNGTHMTIDIKNAEEDTYMELPYIYYPGYQVEMIIEGHTTKLEISETEHGFIRITIPNVDSAFLQVSYTGTILMKMTTIISVFGFVCLIIYISNRDKRKIK